MSGPEPVDEKASAAVGRAEAFIRLSLGWRTSGVVDEDGTDLFETWTTRLGPVCDAVGNDIGAARGLLRCWADGASEDVIPVLAELFTDVGATQEDLNLLTAVGSELDPRRLGSWAEVRGLDRTVGWYIGGAATGQLVRWLPWLAGVDAGWDARRWSRSVSGSPVDVIQIGAPGTGDEAVAMATEALAILGVPLPPDPALGALARHADEGVGIELIAVEGEVVGGGIEVAVTEIDAVVDVLHCLDCGEREVDRVARVRGAAGEPAITDVGASWGLAGLDAVVRLRLA